MPGQITHYILRLKQSLKRDSSLPSLVVALNNIAQLAEDSFEVPHFYDLQADSSFTLNSVL